MSIQITEPGIYDGIPNKAYHADPVPAGSLSVSGAKMLLAPSTPAHFRYAQDNPSPHKDTFDYGTAAHSVVLEGDESCLEVIDAPDWRTKKAQEDKAAAYANGKTPLLTKDLAQVRAMAAAIKAHPIANKLFSNGKPEQSAFWQDRATGIWRRARFDWLPNIDPGRRLIIPDYKTAASAATGKFAKSAADLRYYMQSAWYMDAILEMGLHRDVAFVFVVQEKEAPYVVNVIELDITAVRLGRDMNRRAIEVYDLCQRTGHWPQYAGINLTSLPIYAEREAEGILENAL